MPVVAGGYGSAGGFYNLTYNFKTHQMQIGAGKNAFIKIAANGRRQSLAAVLKGNDSAFLQYEGFCG